MIHVENVGRIRMNQSQNSSDPVLHCSSEIYAFSGTECGLPHSDSLNIVSSKLDSQNFPNAIFCDGCWDTYDPIVKYE